MPLSPILLKGSLHATLWGGSNLATLFGKELPSDTPIGESWETALDSIAQNAPFQGMSLEEITQQLGVRLYGSRAQSIFGDRFPLLAKFIDAHQWLSVQDHPDDAYAAKYENGQLGKTEAWRILAAAPQAEIIHGLAAPCTREMVANAIQTNHLEDLTAKVAVTAGDVIINQAGTLHATGAGIVLYEIQEYSNITYRLYDFGRVDANGKSRELHIDRGLDVLDYHPPRQHQLAPLAISDHEAITVTCKHFAMLETHLTTANMTTRSTDGTTCHILTVIAGAATLQWKDGDTANETAWEVEIPLPLGQTVVIPAEACAYRLSAATEATVLISWVPELTDPVTDTGADVPPRNTNVR